MDAKTMPRGGCEFINEKGIAYRFEPRFINAPGLPTVYNICQRFRGDSGWGPWTLIGSMRSPEGAQRDYLVYRFGIITPVDPAYCDL